MANCKKTLRALLDTIVKNLDLIHHEVDIKAITSGGANYTSELFLVTIKNCMHQLDLFAKVACIGEKMRATMNVKTLYKTEALVYNKLAKVYEELQQKNGIEGDNAFVFPKFYGINEKFLEEAVVLENLTASGYQSYDRFKTIDWDHAAAAVKSMAKFHALSFAYQQERPEEFAEVASELTLKMETPTEELFEVWKQMIARSLAVVDERYRGPIAKYFEQGGEDLFQKFNSPVGKTVLIHADFRPSNLMYKIENDTVHIMPVDYQTVKTGSPANDLLYLIFMGSDAAFREQHFDELVGEYYRQLSAALDRLGVDPAEVYSREEFDGELTQMLPYCLWLGVAILPIVMVEADQAPRVADDDADLSQFVVKSNDLYAERFRGIVADCVRWGILKV